MKRILASLLVVSAFACSGTGNSGSSTTPSTPPLTPTTEIFTGNVPVGGSDAHSFNVTLSNGQLTVTLTAAGPPPTITMGIGVGTPDGATCSLLTNGYVLLPAGTVPQLVGNGVTAGAYCVVIFDAGNQTTPVDYSVTVTHY